MTFSLTLDIGGQLQYVSRFSRDDYQINYSGALILYTTTNVFASSCKSIPEVSVMLAIMDDLPQSSYGT